MQEGVNFSPGQTVRYLGRSSLNVDAILMDRRSLLKDVPHHPYTEDGRCPFQIEVPIVGMVGEFLGYRRGTATIEVQFSFSARPVVFFGAAEDFELVNSSQETNP